MASKTRTAEPVAEPTHASGSDDPCLRPDWLAAATAQGIKPEQALALIGLGLMQRLGDSSTVNPWSWMEADDGGQADLTSLRQRLELTQLALQTGAPLSTAEVTALLGARPGGPVVERGGLKARRLSRNTWKLSRIEGGGSGTTVQDGFRRRL
ncbi:MAG: hypothetical protein QM522_00835 [Chitinophagaceae bacterium]|jgi:hypothetical protein|nr:hypothetical protein [Chitinophagaceae bacterium]